MTARRIYVPAAMPSRDANGRALPAKLRFYEPTGTYDTPKTVYTTSALTTAHAFPIVSDGYGRFPEIWADDAETFDVTYSDQVFDRRLEAYAGVTPLTDAAAASVALAEAAYQATLQAQAEVEEVAEQLGTFSEAISEVQQLVTDTEERLGAAATAQFYASTAAGLAATSSGEYFLVAGDGVQIYGVLYLNNAGVADEIASYPDAAVLNSIRVPAALESYEVNLGVGTIASGGAANVLAGGTGGSPNGMNGASDYRTISGGYDNFITGAIASTIGGGAHHRINAGNSAVCDHALIAGGSYGTITDGHYNTISGGTQNTITAGDSGSIGGGTTNTIASGDSAHIGGGTTNVTKANFDVIGGGSGNQINDTTSTSAVIGGGVSNLILNATASTIAGGNTGKIGTASFSSSYASIGGGLQNAIGQSAQAQYGVIGGGRTNSVNADYGCVPGGRDNQVTGSMAIAMGHEAKASLYAQQALAGGKFSAAGDAQSSILPLRRQTTDATPTALRLGPAGQTRITIATDTTWFFTVYIVARRTDADNESAAYKLEGCLDNNAGTVALVGSVTKTVIAEDTAAWDVAAAADNTNDALEITVTGEAAKTINWVGRLQLVEVTG